jgi:phenylalanyl-tRNA synthetase beta subunit
MDIKVKIEEIFKKIREDKELADKFKDNPVKTVESIIGVDLPDEMINNIITGLKAKLSSDKIDDLLDGFKKLF